MNTLLRFAEAKPIQTHPNPSKPIQIQRGFLSKHNLFAVQSDDRCFAQTKSSQQMIGQTISHYKILSKLGEGGMGVVYKAEDAKLDRPVALKFLAPHLLRDDEARKRFEREAKAAARLDHPNICTVYEIDEADGRTFIVMAFLEGHPLSDRIKEGPLKLPEALSVAAQMAEGLESAH